MPTFDFSFKDFQNLVGKKLPRNHEKLWDILLFVKSEVEELEGDTLNVEVADTNRPDLWCVEGLARALKGALNLETGLPVYKSKKSNYELKVDKSVKKIRPYIACAVVKNLNFNDPIIQQLIQLQLKLDTTYGRRRRKSAIGIYDFDRIKFPVTYKTVKPGGISFIPLGFEKRMTPEEILSEHPKGIEFGSIISSCKKYPILVDADKKVLSMPPIINSDDVGKITEATKNVFVEVTGTSLSNVISALNLVASTLADRGGTVENVKVKYGRKAMMTPVFKSEIFRINKASIIKRLGIELNDKRIRDLLERARFGVKKVTDDSVSVQVPFYRTDIMHEFDVIEDIGIMYGYENIISEDLKISTNGGLLGLSDYTRVLRKLIAGLGYQEILNYYRVDKEVLFNADCVEIANPMSNSMYALRNELLPVSLNFLSRNTHNEYPQKIFEVGRVFEKKKAEVSEHNHLILVACGADADFTTVRQETEWVLNNLSVKYEIKEYDHGAFIKGRCAAIIIKDKVAGYFGEINPETLARFNLENPAIALELNLKKLMQ